MLVVVVGTEVPQRAFEFVCFSFGSLLGQLAVSVIMLGD